MDATYFICNPIMHACCSLLSLDRSNEKPGKTSKQLICVFEFDVHNKNGPFDYDCRVYGCAFVVSLRHLRYEIKVDSG